MAVSAQRITTSASPQAVNTASPGGQRLHLRNADATNSISLGASGVAAGAGFGLAATQTIIVEVLAGEVLFCIADAGTPVLHVLRVAV